MIASEQRQSKIELTSSSFQPMDVLCWTWSVTVLGRLPPAAPSDSPDVICPPRWGPTYAAFTGAFTAP
ncbi:jg20605 [Pararge aegeria aegeria]|uniref:Jg20605 protein n=1 Tax=Pararge aegeria aegeria TaxID=348720 RepID=A0A8S4R560_9NEOP|nr:jg20605 [Pararge aegeria aegeria]